ncbi:MAG: 5-formyltetrahydrofolate cyclo-ligase [Huintestinicola sp.]
MNTFANNSPVSDIREYKKALRAKFKDIRRNMMPEEKAAKDKMIFDRIVKSNAYKQASVVLTYVSTDIEVDTTALIRQAVADKKRVAVPRCIEGTRDMDFYFITSLDDLEPGSFSVLEPVVSKCVKAYAFETALCIVPGLSFDMTGYRLGYGKGYYDRFLSAHPKLYKMGICYCSCTVNELLHGRFDVRSDAVVTEKYIRRVNTERMAE